MLAKIKCGRGELSAVALALLLAGCTPAGPRALWEGKQHLDRGDLAGALAEFQRATTLLATNANAWNYLGVALHRAGRPSEAAAAYQTALRIDHDLVEAHLNLGVLSLEQNQPETARTELTAYTLRRPNDPAGWLKLGFAQLKAGGNILSAERSFSAVLALKANDAEAFNALGLASLQAGKPRDAAQFFAAAVQVRPQFGPARLNLATVNLDYLHDPKLALANYQSYLALTPQPANYREVQAIVARLAQSEAASAVVAPAVAIKTSAPPVEPKPKPAGAPPPQAPPATPPATTRVVSPPAVAQPVKDQVEPLTVAATTTNRALRAPLVTPTRPATNEVGSRELVTAPAPDANQSRPALLHRPPSPEAPTGAAKPGFRADNLTPIPATTKSAGGPGTAATAAEPKPQSAPAEARYVYRSPAKPLAGDRRTAEGLFNSARLAEQAEKWAEALQAYEGAAAADPAWFEAQYNAGLNALRLHDYARALPHYELALALQPDSATVRYYFARALRSSGYNLDAAEELKKILAASPNDVPAHLDLANLCAQSLHDVAQARQHYLRVLEMQPDHPQANNIRYWLSANAK